MEPGPPPRAQQTEGIAQHSPRRRARGEEAAALRRWDLTNELASDARALLTLHHCVWCLCALLQALFFSPRLIIACKKTKPENQGTASARRGAFRQRADRGPRRHGRPGQAAAPPAAAASLTAFTPAPPQI